MTLESLQRELERRGARSLSGQRATSLLTLAGDDTRVAKGLALVVGAMLEHFPENIFWDLDIVAQALADGTDPEKIVRVQLLYGNQGPIRFRYVHDFVYGFDWAKWVRKDPKARAQHAPFSDAFLDYSFARGLELLELIANDDAKYGQLEDGAPRNPFGFSREPDDEARLLEDLAKRELLPVRAWDPASTPKWDERFAELRAERASALSI